MFSFCIKYSTRNRNFSNHFKILHNFLHISLHNQNLFVVSEDDPRVLNIEIKTFGQITARLKNSLLRTGDHVPGLDRALLDVNKFFEQRVKDEGLGLTP